MLIVLVVNLHACVTYSHVGDWYFMSAQEPTLAAKVPFILWQAHLQSFFMGLLFFISAYFAHGSIARRGVGAFVRERLLRLGLPALLYMLVIHPFILLVLNPWNFNFGPPAAFYVNYLRTGKFLGSTGPLWFVVALLLFSLIFAAWRSMRPLSNDPRPATAPTGAFLLLFALVLGFGSFAMRLVQPIGTNVLNMQLCFFVQYIAFFLAGWHAARHGWLLPLASSSCARTAGRLALFGGPVLLLAIIIIGSRAAGPEAFFGGWRWQSFGYAVWEQLAGVGLSLGLLALFSRKCNIESQLLRWLSDRSFGVYCVARPSHNRSGDALSHLAAEHLCPCRASHTYRTYCQLRCGRHRPPPTGLAAHLVSSINQVPTLGNSMLPGLTFLWRPQ
ncbi:MAG: acyltransferase [Betaproteobacteria bacterium]|nr:acyltransferase [Betaproteobacteria bacterium]